MLVKEIQRHLMDHVASCHCIEFAIYALDMLNPDLKVTTDEDVVARR